MAVTPQLQAQIAAIQSRIEAVAADASPEDLVMLAKAVEAVGGQATVFDLVSVAQEQRTALEDDTQAHLSALEVAVSQATQDIVHAQSEAITLVQNVGQTLASAHALVLMF